MMDGQTFLGLACLLVSLTQAAVYQPPLPVIELPSLLRQDALHEFGEPFFNAPNENDTLHDGLKFFGSPKARAATLPNLDTSSAAVQKQIVDTHNGFRRAKPSTDMFRLSWDSAIQKVAQQWADLCEFRHPATTAERSTYLKTSDFSLGQNIAMGSGSSFNWARAMQLWYNEVNSFTFGVATSAMVGHYTAIVWAKTYKIGCGYKLCKAGTPHQFNFMVCDYGPAGNVVPNQFKPYTPGSKCGKCPKACDDGLCTNPCPYTNDYSNCQAPSGGVDALFPTGCANAPSYLQDYKSSCKATCNCYGKLLY
ncbi:hypothetical protein RvY_16952 [Ramazzottius varieornatus]|uniref:ShKT domain-containing protein n=1 Tax=Ramazzottius varieornatus TaxID=947166 RepID=A0A1D1W0E0_RAMVA|nr:hypothetical protein RvY_16952 [Ramazzottius varieornatus]